MNAILLHHIKKSVPSLNAQIQATLTSKENELKQSSVTTMTGDPLLDIDSSQIVLVLINKFINVYADMLEGRFVEKSVVEMQGGSRISYIFHGIFSKIINSIDPFEYLTESDI